MADEECRKGGDGGGAPAWMATFGDLMSLLLTFFILLLSFATMDIEKFRDALGSVQESLGVNPMSGTGVFSMARAPVAPQTSISPPVSFRPPPARAVREDLNREVAEKVRRFIRRKGIEDEVSIEDSARGVIVRVEGRLFFNPGTADMKPEVTPLLDEIAGIIRKNPDFHVAIEGHTDNIPIRSRRFRSNWELSAARAYSALQYLTEKVGVEADRLSIAGFADTRPLASNDDPEGRARNRRVEFVFSRPDKEEE